MLRCSHCFFAPPDSAPPARTPGSAVAVKMERTLLIKCCIAAALVIVLWILGYSFPLVAISVGAFILIIGRVKSQNIYQRLDWELLLFFASLFVVIKGFEASGAIEHVIGYFQLGAAGRHDFAIICGERRDADAFEPGEQFAGGAFIPLGWCLRSRTRITSGWRWPAPARSPEMPRRSVRWRI